MMAKFEIEIPEDVIPAGYEPVAFRCPRAGDTYAHDGDATYAQEDEPYCYLILRKSWQWPDWLECDWIAKNASGVLQGFFNEKPQHDLNRWKQVNSTGINMIAISNNIAPEGDWRNSLRENPRRKQKNAEFEAGSSGQ